MESAGRLAPRITGLEIGNIKKDIKTVLCQHVGGFWKVWVILDKVCVVWVDGGGGRRRVGGAARVHRAVQHLALGTTKPQLGVIVVCGEARSCGPYNHR